MLLFFQYMSEPISPTLLSLDIKDVLFNSCAEENIRECCTIFVIQWECEMLKLFDFLFRRYLTNRGVNFHNFGRLLCPPSWYNYTGFRFLFSLPLFYLFFGIAVCSRSPFLFLFLQDLFQRNCQFPNQLGIRKSSLLCMRQHWGAL